MNKTSKRILIAVVSLAVCAVGAAAMVGWIWNIEALKSVVPGWPTMKFDTALSFVVSSISFYYISRALEGAFDRAQVILSASCLILFLVMGILFFSFFLEVRTGVEELFVKELPGGVMTVAAGKPSLPTAINFLLIALAGILTLLQVPRLRIKLRALGLVSGVIGLVAMGGYVLHVPLLFYYVPGVNTAMAFHTALLFVLLGAGFVCL